MPPHKKPYKHAGMVQSADLLLQQHVAQDGAHAAVCANMVGAASLAVSTSPAHVHEPSQVSPLARTSTRARAHASRVAWLSVLRRVLARAQKPVRENSA